MTSGTLTRFFRRAGGIQFISINFKLYYFSPIKPNETWPIDIKKSKPELQQEAVRYFKK